MSKKKRPNNKRIGKLESEILQRVSAGDMLVGMLLSGRSIKSMRKTAQARAASRQATQRALMRLTAKGYIVAEDNKLQLSQKGMEEVESIISRMRLNTEASRISWDGKWRLVAFDIPEDLRSLRNVLRGILKRSGFLLLQQSVWVYPYECRELQRLLREDQRLSRCVVYATVGEINDESRLLQHYNLHKRNKI